MSIHHDANSTEKEECIVDASACAQSHTNRTFSPTPNATAAGPAYDPEKILLRQAEQTSTLVLEEVSTASADAPSVVEGGDQGDERGRNRPIGLEKESRAGLAAGFWGRQAQHLTRQKQRLIDADAPLARPKLRHRRIRSALGECLRHQALIRVSFLSWFVFMAVGGNIHR